HTPVCNWRAELRGSVRLPHGGGARDARGRHLEAFRRPSTDSLIASADLYVPPARTPGVWAMNLRKPSVCLTCKSVLPRKTNTLGYAASGACIVCNRPGCDQCSRVFGWTQTWDSGDPLSLRKPGFQSVP